MTEVLAFPGPAVSGTSGGSGRSAPAGADAGDVETPIDAYLRAQQDLTAVERFARHHDAGEVPALAGWYRDLMPAAPPEPGHQYAFSVDLDRCTGCKACVAACHSLNGLDEGESFRSVGLLVGERPAPADPARLEPWQQTVTTACHHCVEPACLAGCPVDAYEKDPVTGIVRHLDDQCIGCSYCTLTCPYEVPRYNARLGIVRKCDLCSDRLAVGEAPACVQACPTQAISITTVDVAEVVAEVVAGAGAAVGAGAGAGVDGPAATALVPSAPPSRLTAPTTRYTGRRPLPASARAADERSLRPAHAHVPLAVMLVLTQASVGAFLADSAVRALAAPRLGAVVQPYGAAGSLIVGLLALGASVLHLGRPRRAWRAVIGLRHSWLSREIVAFSAFAGAATADAAAAWLGAPGTVRSALRGGVAVAGLAGIACSVSIYAVTGRRWWRWPTTAAKFVLTTATTGPALAVALAVAASVARVGDLSALAAVRPLLWIVVVATLAKLAVDVSVLRNLRDGSPADLRRTALLLRDDLRRLAAWRVWSAAAGGIAAPLLLVRLWSSPSPSPVGSAVLAVVLVSATTWGELAERRLFFSAVSAPRMPGGPA
ncbi:MAG: dimethyl sulfoxide reductase anchor subunit [Actinobacteria bacterium]|nr:dimethyl sulfoxide reductase anchor subunit [Actinomycetota bacterium]